MLYGFSRSERVLFGDVFAELIPHAVYTECSVYDRPQTGSCGAAIVNCTFNRWNALEAAGCFLREQKQVILFSSVVPDRFFLYLVRNAAASSERLLLLPGPESRAEISACAEAFARHTRYIPPSVLKRCGRDHGFRLLQFDQLRSTDRYIVYGLLSGKCVKEIASLVPSSPHYIENRIQILKERFKVLQLPELQRAALGWISYRDQHTAL
jgi:hypothetical protein